MISLSILKKISILFKEKRSPFGLKVIGYKLSTIFAYIFLFMSYFLNPMFGYEKKQLITGFLFNIILESSLLILIINSYLQKRKKDFWLYWITNIFFLFYLPVCIFKIFLFTSLLIRNFFGILNFN